MRFTVYIPWDAFWIAPLVWLVVGLILFPLMWWMSELLRHRNPGEKMRKPGWRPVVRASIFWPIIMSALIWEHTLGKRKSRKAMERYRAERERDL